MPNFLHQFVSPFREVGHHFIKPLNVLKGSIKFLNGYKNLSFGLFTAYAESPENSLHVGSYTYNLPYTAMGLQEEARISNVLILKHFLPT